MNPTFERYIGIDYSGAETPKSSLKGLRVYKADRLTSAYEFEPPPSSRKYWTRRGIAEWVVKRLTEGSPTLVGIHHGFSFTNELLFHELVHVVQYEKLGLTDFAGKYVRGFLSGGSYEAIPLEMNAYQLAARFAAAPMNPFSVEEGIQVWINAARF